VKELWFIIYIVAFASAFELVGAILLAAEGELFYCICLLVCTHFLAYQCASAWHTARMFEAKHRSRRVELVDDESGALVKGEEVSR